MLQIVTLLSLQDGSVLDAVMLWKKNVDKVLLLVPCTVVVMQYCDRPSEASLVLRAQTSS